MEKLRASGCPAAALDVFNEHLDYSCATEAKTASKLIQLQIEGGVAADRIVSVSWTSLKDWPGLPAKIVRDYANFTARAYGAKAWPDGYVLHIIAMAGTVDLDEVERQYLFDNLVIPLMEQAAKRERFDLLLDAEVWVYERFIKRPESEENFGARYKKLVPCLREAGIAYGQRIAKEAVSAPVTHPGKPRIAFFTHRASHLAHVEAMREALRGYQRLGEQPFEPVIFFGSVYAEKYARDFEAVGVSPIFLARSKEDGPTEIIGKLRRQMAELGCSALVFVSVAQWMAFAFAARLAPVQIWWSLKYHALETPEIDDYVAGGQGTERIIHGRILRAVQLCPRRCGPRPVLVATPLDPLNGSIK